MLRGYKPKWKKAIWFDGKPVVNKPKPIARYSRENKKRQSQYNRKVGKWKKTHPKCCFPGCSCQTDDNHHTRGKLKDLLMDERWWAPLCRSHHNWVRDNPVIARGVLVLVDGKLIPLLAEQGGWNSQPKD